MSPKIPRLRLGMTPEPCAFAEMPLEKLYPLLPGQTVTWKDGGGGG